jgi:uncharacterized protein YidB (DUF937 family)
MGLMDILNGMQNGPRGQSQPAPSGSQSSGGMSPIMMALLGLLAYKAMKGGGLGGMLGGSTPTQPAPTPSPGATGGIGDVLGGLLGGSRPAGAPSGGGLDDLLGGLLGGSSNRSAGAPGGMGDILGGLLGGSAAGTALNGGLGNLINDLQNSGQGRAAQSWVSGGANEPIEPQDLRRALGADTIDALSARTGLAQEDLLTGLSQYLPQMVDQLTPDGRLPTEDEAARW